MTRMYRSHADYQKMVSACAAEKQRDRRRIFRIFLLAAFTAAIVLLAYLTLSARVANAGTPDPGSKYYASIAVEPGDTIWSIAQEHMGNGWTDIRDYVSELQQVNGLDSDTIHAGNRLIVPYCE